MRDAALSSQAAVRIDERSLAEIRDAVAEALGRFGVAGDVAVRSDRLVLHGNGPTVTLGIAELAAQWPGLDPELRRRRTAELARRLVADRRSAMQHKSERKRIRVPEWLAPVAIVAVAAAALFGLYVAYQSLSRGATGQAVDRKPSGQDNVDSYERQRETRAADVCEKTRSRVMRGALVGPADVEGWVVEHWFLSSRPGPVLIEHPALAGFVQPVAGEDKSRLAWDGAPALAQVDGPDTAVVLVPADVVTGSAVAWRGLRLVFTGRYVVPYFDEVARADYLRLGAALADALGADYGGVYARCATQKWHHVGAWFRGPTPGGATAALIFFMGVFADVPHLSGSVLAPGAGREPDWAYAFGRIAATTASLTKARVSHSLGPHGGMVAGADAGPSIITFPLRDANRASRASLEIARELDIGTLR